MFKRPKYLHNRIFWQEQQDAISLWGLGDQETISRNSGSEGYAYMQVCLMILHWDLGFLSF